jgi:hypothetical protein
MMLNCGGRTKEVLVEVLKGSTEQEEEVAFDPSLLAPEQAVCAEVDSNGLASDDEVSDDLESDDEVKAVLEQLDESIPQLSQNTLTVSDTVVSQDSLGDGKCVESRIIGKRKGRGEGTSSGRSAERNVGGELPPRVSKRQAGDVALAGREDALNSAEFRARPELPSRSDKAKTIDTISEKELRANKTTLGGRKIKRSVPQLGGAWDFVRAL